MKNGQYGQNGQYGRDGLSMGSISSISESRLEKAALEWFKSLDYKVLHGPDLAPVSAFPCSQDNHHFELWLFSGNRIILLALALPAGRRKIRKNLCDGLHLSNAGHRRLAEIIWTIVGPGFEK
jgi:hypothetical protein